MSRPWLHIVGIGEDGVDGLSATAKAVLGDAEVFVGGVRHLEMLDSGDDREKIVWPSPLSAVIDKLRELSGRRVCVLATGDPFCFGIGTTLARSFDLDEMITIPAPSAFAHACARLGWSRHETDCLTLHGRPVEMLNAAVRPDARLLVLSNDKHTPGQIAERLCEAGLEASQISVLEHMGGPKERRLNFTASDISDQEFADFNTVAVHCVAGPKALWRPSSPGLPDDAFKHDGTMTKQEVRAITLAALGPTPGQLLWDVGAGCGSVAVEWMRADPRCRAIAVEAKAERRDYIADNANALGVPQLKIIASEAPKAFAGLDRPDAIFIGGGLTTDNVFETCWKALKPGGRIVANAVTLDGEQRLHHIRGAHGGELRRIDISRAAPLGAFEAWRPLAPITQWNTTKPWSEGS